MQVESESQAKCQGQKTPMTYCLFFLPSYPPRKKKL